MYTAQVAFEIRFLRERLSTIAKSAIYSFLSVLRSVVPVEVSAGTETRSTLVTVYYDFGRFICDCSVQFFENLHVERAICYVRVSSLVSPRRCMAIVIVNAASIVASIGQSIRIGIAVVHTIPMYIALIAPVVAVVCTCMMVSVVTVAVMAVIDAAGRTSAAVKTAPIVAIGTPAHVVCDECRSCRCEKYLQLDWFDA